MALFFFLKHVYELLYLRIGHLELLLWLIFQLGAATYVSYVAGILQFALNSSYPTLLAPLLLA